MSRGCAVWMPPEADECREGYACPLTQDIIDALEAADAPESSNPFMTQSAVANSGTTANRPAVPVTGQMYFDTTLGRPVWYNGAAWVDATGAPV